MPPTAVSTHQPVRLGGGLAAVLVPVGPVAVAGHPAPVSTPRPRPRHRAVVLQLRQLELPDLEVVGFLPGLEDVLQPVLDHLPLRPLHSIHQHIGGGDLHTVTREPSTHVSGEARRLCLDTLLLALSPVFLGPGGGGGGQW